MFKKIFAFLIIFNCVTAVAVEICDQPENLGKSSYFGLTRTLQNDSGSEIKNSARPRKNQRFSFMRDLISIFNFFKPSGCSDSKNDNEDEPEPVNFPALSKEDIECIDWRSVNLNYFCTENDEDEADKN
jgi:hypothetical protein